MHVTCGIAVGAPLTDDVDAARAENVGAALYAFAGMCLAS